MNNVLNNTLNLFPSTTTPQQTQAKLQKLVYNATSNSRGPTEIQRTIANSLFDDTFEYMNTLDMNRAAAFTYGYHNAYGQNGTTINALGGGTHGESVANELWELVIDWTLSRYTQHSVLVLTKTISLIQHVLLQGSEACVMNGELLYRIEMAVEPLRKLNTALIEQQMVEQILNNEGRASGENDIVLSTDGIQHQLAQFGTKATATMLKLRGGSVDKGYPVRTAASKLYSIVSQPNNLRQLRMQQQQGGSLVPIGSTKQVGYITDEGRYRLLQEKMAREEKVLKQKQVMEQQRLRQTKSNLAGSSAVDSFGGGVTQGNGGKVVGAANSLEDMINSARYELEQHKSKRQQKISSLKKGFTDDPYTRQRQVEELEKNNIESDPEFRKKEAALKEALEYLEEMQREEQERVGDLLEGDLLGDTSNVAAGNTSIDNVGEDLLGFASSNPNPTPQVDVFGMSSTAPITSTNDTATHGGSADLLGFSSDVNSTIPQHMPTQSNMPNGIINIEPIGQNNTTPMNGSLINNTKFDLRPSLVTGMSAGTSSSVPIEPPPQPPPSSTAHFSDLQHDDVSSMGAMGGVQGTPIGSLQESSLQQKADEEEAQAEKSRKMQIAAGLFAGVPSHPSVPQQAPIMQQLNSSNISALDYLIPVSDTSQAPSASTTNNISAFDDNAHNDAIPVSDTFGLAMGGSSTHDDNNTSIPIPPPMAPPPPPMAPPPPPHPTAMAPPINNGNNNLLGNNPSVEQMQEMIRQQQEQMNQMMQMMASMQTPNSGGG